MTETALSTSTETAKTLSATTLDNSPSLYQSARDVFAERLAQYGPFIFIAQPEGQAPSRFLEGLAEGNRQEYTCQTCAQFLRNTANFVFIKDDGTLISALWDSTRVPEFYRSSIERLQYAAENAPVGKMFLPRDFDEYSKGGRLVNRFNGRFGAETKGGFNHFSLDVPATNIDQANKFQHTALTRRNLLRDNLLSPEAELPKLRTVLALFESGKLFRGDVMIPWIEWIIAQKEFFEAKLNQKLRDNALMKIACNAPAGWVEFRGSLLGALINDVTKANALTDRPHAIDYVIDEYNKRADPTRYMRAVAEATEGNIRAAAKKLQESGLEPAMHRRWAKISEVAPFATWLPKPSTAVDATVKNATGTIFDKLLPKTEEKQQLNNVAIPDTSMPLFKFLRDVLPTAEKIEAQLPMLMTMGGFTTATLDDAPKIMQWDRDDARNPFCPFVLQQPQRPDSIGLRANHWTNVLGLFHQPQVWTFPDKQKTAAPLHLLLEGATKFELSSSALFAEALISEMHPFRATVEQYSNQTALGEVPTAEKAIFTNILVGMKLRVSVGNKVTTYVITDLTV